MSALRLTMDRNMVSLDECADADWDSDQYVAEGPLSR
jgi:hypothetical protein